MKRIVVGGLFVCVMYVVVSSALWLAHANGDVGVMSEGYVAKE